MELFGLAFDRLPPVIVIVGSCDSPEHRGGSLRSTGQAERDGGVPAAPAVVPGGADRHLPVAVGALGKQRGRLGDRGQHGSQPDDLFGGAVGKATCLRLELRLIPERDVPLDPIAEIEGDTRLGAGMPQPADADVEVAALGP